MSMKIVVDVEIRLINSKLFEISFIRRWLGRNVLKLANWLLKSEIEVDVHEYE
jgi:hypothetical protein